MLVHSGTGSLKVPGPASGADTDFVGELSALLGSCSCCAAPARASGSTEPQQAGAPWREQHEAPCH